MLIKNYHKKRRITWLFILPLFLAWINSALGLPLLSMAMGNFHKVFLTYKHGKAHLNFCHHEKQGNNGLVVRGLRDHKHDCLFNSTNHEFHLSSFFIETATVKKIAKVFEPLISSVAIDWSMPEYFDSASIKHFPQTFSETNSTLFSLLKVVLLI